MKPFANDFNDLFGDDKPNASLTSWQEGEFHNHAFEIYSIKRKNGQYHLKTDLLEGTYLDVVLANEQRCQGIGCIKHTAIDQVSFFLDPIIEQRLLDSNNKRTINLLTGKNIGVVNDPDEVGGVGGAILDALDSF